jgi:sugar phosphate isomerase/epimerase
MTALGLHTWTLDTTPLPRILEVARAAGWDAVELRAVDFDRARQAGRADDDVLAAVRGAGLPVACVGAKSGWMFAEGDARTALLQALGDACRRARALDCALVMSPADPGRGPVARAAANVKEAGNIAAEHGVRLAIEPGSQAEQLNRIDPLREVLAAAGHPRCGVLVDTYHVERSGDWRAVEALGPGEIFYVQYSDVAAETRPGYVLDRLPPGRGRIPFRDVFALLASKGYTGYLTYEAPNESAWARDATEVAREAASASRSLLPR